MKKWNDEKIDEKEKKLATLRMILILKVNGEKGEKERDREKRERDNERRK